MIWGYFAQVRVALVLLAILGCTGLWLDYRSTKADLAEARTALQSALKSTQLGLDLRASENAAKARADASVRLFESLTEEYSKYANSVRARAHREPVRLPNPTARSGPATEGAAPGARAAGAGSTCELPEAAASALVALAVEADELALKYNALLDYAKGLTCEVPHVPEATPH